MLTSGGGLNEMWTTLSVTVRDAIIACEKLGERYLWTDCLCIMQDSVRDMKVQISWMRQIYSAAKCTITAVSSETADIGLLGCKTEDRGVPTTEDHLANVIRTAPWNKRAWCYQESALSHRLILFTSSGIFMQCQQSSYDIYGAELAGNRHSDSGKFSSCGGMLYLSQTEDPLESYIHAVQHYSQRKLSKPEDKLNAFSGILQRYQQVHVKEGFSLHYGLPVAAFDQAFCWRMHTHSPSNRNSAFPSWSWLGWIGPVTFNIDMLRKARTDQMLYRNDKRFKSSDMDWRAALELRKPARSGLLQPQDNENACFGFPEAQPLNTSDRSSLWLDASITRLLIAADPSCSEGTQALYAVYPVHCTQEPPKDPPKTITLREALEMHVPTPKLMDKETAAAPSVPTLNRLGDDYDARQHNQHFDCEFKAPIGHVWLHQGWRMEQPKDCTMEFMALSGRRDATRHDQWIIETLMLLQRMEKNGHYWAHERLQVMNCCIDQQLWLQIRAETCHITLI